MAGLIALEKGVASSCYGGVCVCSEMCQGWEESRSEMERGRSHNEIVVWGAVSSAVRQGKGILRIARRPQHTQQMQLARGGGSQAPDLGRVGGCAGAC